MDAQELNRDYRLRWFDFDRFGHIRPETLLDLFQDMATLQAESMGIGYDAMNERGAFWAVTRLKYEIVQEPQRFQVITVSTWPHSPGKYSFLRDYEIRDQGGHTLVRATSEWMPLDQESRAFLKVADFYDGATLFLDKRSFATKPKKIRVDAKNLCRSHRVIPHFTSIDVNGHVNNSRHPGFVLDAIDPQRPLAIKTLQIDYRQELLPNVPFIIQWHRQGNVIVASALHDDAVAFNCEITLEEKED